MDQTKYCRDEILPQKLACLSRAFPRIDGRRNHHVHAAGAGCGALHVAAESRSLSCLRPVSNRNGRRCSLLVIAVKMRRVSGLLATGQQAAD
jgi:hypothetical protein